MLYVTLELKVGEKKRKIFFFAYSGNIFKPFSILRKIKMKSA